MSLGELEFMYLTEITSKSLGDNFLSKVYDIHHKHKIDYPVWNSFNVGQRNSRWKK